MVTELNKSYPTARKEHRCSWCGGTIKVGEKYERSTLIYDGQIYDFVCHLECRKATELLNVFDYDMGDGVDEECFVQCLQDWLYEHHYNDETDTYDEGFDPDVVSYHDIVLKIVEELKA
ncbi:MAG: hypothetical protein IKA96_06355 [Alistipes sp.]|nr:hypothetical protein [Alistipes sp.]MBR2628713.1 hypothetical protein [Alistipes sp.]